MEHKHKAYFINIVLLELLTQKLKSEIEGARETCEFCFCGSGDDNDDSKGIGWKAKRARNKYYTYKVYYMYISPTAEYQSCLYILIFNS